MTALLLLALTIAGPATNSTLPADPLVEIRAAAARYLARELSRFEAADQLSDAEVRDVAARTRNLLEGSRLQSRLDGYERRSTRDNLAILKSIYAATTFEVVREAAVPVGFPEPTLVGEIEIKRYPAYRMARATMGAGGTIPENLAFWALFQHIQSNEISMTAPVEMGYGERGTEASMAFLYGAPEIGELGKDGRVEVVDVPAQVTVSLGMRGSRQTSRIEAATRALRSWIDAQPGWNADGDVRVLGYNSPSVRGNRQYFEVQIPVRAVPRTEWL